MQPDERLAYLERVVARLTRRQVKKIVSVVPAVPVCLYGIAPDEGGVLARFMFPASGMLKKVSLYFVGIEKPTIANVEFERAGMSQRYEFTVGKRGLVEEVAVTIEALDRVTLRAAQGPLWAAFLWQPAMKDGEIKTHLLDELEAEVGNASTSTQA